MHWLEIKHKELTSIGEQIAVMEELAHAQLKCALASMAALNTHRRILEQYWEQYEESRRIELNRRPFQLYKSWAAPPPPVTEPTAAVQPKGDSREDAGITDKHKSQFDEKA